MKRSKRYQGNLEKLVKASSIKGAIEALQKMKRPGFDESVEVHAKLNIDPSKSQQQVRFTVGLPHGTGKTPKIAVFCEGGDAKAAKEAKADYVWGEGDIPKIGSKIKIDFDVALATPPMMPKLARIAKILGPKGLMPSPKNETVTANIGKSVEQLKKGKANVKSDAGGSIHQVIGKISYKKEELEENYRVLMEALEKQKPGKLKGRFIKRITLTTTMGPGVKIKN